MCHTVVYGNVVYHLPLGGFLEQGFRHEKYAAPPTSAAPILEIMVVFLAISWSGFLSPQSIVSMKPSRRQHTDNDPKTVTLEGGNPTDKQVFQLLPLCLKSGEILADTARQHAQATEEESLLATMHAQLRGTVSCNTACTKQPPWNPSFTGWM